MSTARQHSRGPRHDRRALNAAADAAPGVRAFCFALPEVAAGAVPEWIPFLPAPDASGRVQGEDGRAWIIRDARALAASLKRKLPIDINHSTDLAAKAGGESPAVGWITELQVRDDGSMWARADWNTRGLNALREREYGFISPFFDFDPKTSAITRLAGGSLVNEPNFTSLALNHRNPEDASMLQALLALLGLAATATQDEAERAINTLKTDRERALNAASTPDLQRFVPRADYDSVLTRATNAEKAVQDAAAAKTKVEIDTEVDAAIAAGKITPATADYHRANCARDGGLAAFREFVKAQPVIVSEEERLKGKPPAGAATAKGDGAQELAQRALNYQKAQADMGRAITISEAVNHCAQQPAA